ncbi:MAG TPA: hypothetical protein VH142_28045, partial [Polyangiaceae bacterium]|nr:hypothetical protein [Polyangiaceae bacterium]
MGFRQKTALVAFTLSVTGVANADPPAAAAPPAFLPPPPVIAPTASAAPVAVYVGTDTGEPAVIGIYPEWVKPGHGSPLARCTTPCQLEMQRGRYRIDVEASDATLEGNRVVDIAEPSRLVVTPRHPAQRSVGLALGLVGSAAVVGGSILVLVALNDTDSCALDGFDCSRTV